MNPRLKIFLPLTGLLVGLGSGALIAYFKSKDLQVNSRTVGAVLPPAGGSVTSGQVPAKTNVGAETAAPMPTPSAQLQRFRDWQREEARAVGGTPVNEQAHLAVLEAKLKTFTEVEWNEVVRQLLDKDGPANERVLSAYLLGHGGFANLAAVERVLDEKLPEGPLLPHSEDETRLMREKSLRLTIIDELIAEAKKDPARREVLAQTIRRIDDPYLRDLATRRAREEGLF
jgi:hypothetical protein